MPARPARQSVVITSGHGRVVLAAMMGALAAACTATPSSTPDAGTVTLTPQVGRFTSVTVGSAFTATTIRGANPSVRITVPAAVKDRVVAVTQGDRLELSLSPGPGDVGDQPLLATVVVAAPLRSVTAQQAASVDATASGSLGGDVELQASGAATVTAAVNATDLTADVSGAATVLVTGQTHSATVTASGAASFKGFDLESGEVTATAQSASTIELTAIRSLSAHATGASTISYRGTPATTVDKDTSSTVQPG